MKCLFSLQKHAFKKEEIKGKCAVTVCFCNNRGGDYYIGSKKTLDDATWIPLTNVLLGGGWYKHFSPFIEAHVDSLPVFRSILWDILRLDALFPPFEREILNFFPPRLPLDSLV